MYQIITKGYLKICIVAKDSIQSIFCDGQGEKQTVRVIEF